ncbi:hypothetical protein Esti_000305 [Eimeria stiedai]
MSGFDTAVRGGLRFKRHSEALVVDEKRRKKKKKQNDKQGESGPVVVGLPPELAEDAAAVAAASALEAGKDLSEALHEHRKEGAEMLPQEEGTDASPSKPSPAGDETDDARASSNPRSTSREASQPQEAVEDVEALLAETNPHWTQAERAFFLARKAREAERIKKQLQLTHRQRMEKFNQHLASLSEHFDQPRIGPG